MLGAGSSKYFESKGLNLRLGKVNGASNPEEILRRYEYYEDM